ncbi:MAG TPA: hypothetical protein VEV15_00305, partial [Flavisolibacter sp.]|nr:hypothetical protein [Flavisolibacter sp.]
MLVTLAFSIAITWRSEARHIAYSEIYSTLTTDTVPLPKKNRLVEIPKKDSGTTSPKDSANRIKQGVITDTAAGITDTLRVTDTIPPRQQVDTFSLKLSKDTLDAPINYEAEDSAVLLVKENKFLLYGNTKTTYKDITLTAPKVEMD